MSEEIALTPIEHLGEFGLIHRLTKDHPAKKKEVLKGVGDDAAVLDLDGENVQVVTTDMLVEGIHFDLSYCPLKHLGYKSVVVNLSDIFAMNAKPVGVTVSIAMSNRFPVEAMEELYAGIYLACEKYDVEVIGGDTSTSRMGLIISVTAIGTAKKENVVYRSGAKEFDLICVTGDLGAAYAGLQILEREKKVFKDNPEIQPDLEGFDYTIGRQLKPEARGDAIVRFESEKILPSSMIDISDGLANDLEHICIQSKVGAQIYQEKLPIDYETEKVAELFDISTATYALNGGEDYELLFTVDQYHFEKIKSIEGMSVIGHITDQSAGINFVTTGNESIPLQSKGWDHFKPAE